jgi:hypothetical protein
MFFIWLCGPTGATGFLFYVRQRQRWSPPLVLPVTTMKTKNKKRVCLPCRLAHSACDGYEPLFFYFIYLF